MEILSRKYQTISALRAWHLSAWCTTTPLCSASGKASNTTKQFSDVSQTLPKLSIFSCFIRLNGVSFYLHRSGAGFYHAAVFPFNLRTSILQVGTQHRRREARIIWYYPASEKSFYKHSFHNLYLLRIFYITGQVKEIAISEPHSLSCCWNRP